MLRNSSLELLSPWEAAESVFGSEPEGPNEDQSELLSSYLSDLLQMSGEKIICWIRSLPRVSVILPLFNIVLAFHCLAATSNEPCKRLPWLCAIFHVMLNEIISSASSLFFLYQVSLVYLLLVSGCAFQLFPVRFLSLFCLHPTECSSFSSFIFIFLSVSGRPALQCP